MKYDHHRRVAVGLSILLTIAQLILVEAATTIDLSGPEILA